MHSHVEFLDVACGESGSFPRVHAYSGFLMALQHVPLPTQVGRELRNCNKLILRVCFYPQE